MTPEATLSAALQALLQFQTATPIHGLPDDVADRLRAELELFPRWCVQREFGRTWDATEQALWARICARLVDSALAQPRVALRARGAEGSEQPVSAGPITADVVALLRDDGLAEDEGAELDLVVRWWDAARRTGLPVDADFGECWRALEWMGLQRHLMLLGQACRDHVEHREGRQSADEAHAARVAKLLAAASKVALRYAPLKPLLRLLQPLQGAPLGAGYTF